MFGYRRHRSELKVREFEVYRAHYAASAMRFEALHAGFSASLTYDSALYPFERAWRIMTG